MASRAELTARTDESTGQRFVQIEGKIYEQIVSTRSDRRLPEPGATGWGAVAAEPGWQEAGSRRGQRWQRAHKLQEKQLSFKGAGKGGSKPSGQKQPPGATAAEKKGAGKGTYKGGSRPQGGAYNPSTRPWVPCCYPLCPGHQGKKSFKYIDSLGEGENGHKCMGCGTNWAESVKSQLAWGAVVGLSPATANHSLASTADSKSPFTAAEDINIVIKDTSSSAPFAKPPTAPTAFKQLPEAARNECPKEFLPLLERHLLGSGLTDAELEPFKAAMEAGNDLGKRFMAAVAVGKAALEAKILPPTAAPKIQTRHGPITPAQE